LLNGSLITENKESSLCNKVLTGCTEGSTSEARQIYRGKNES